MGDLYQTPDGFLGVPETVVQLDSQHRQHESIEIVIAGVGISRVGVRSSALGPGLDPEATKLFFEQCILARNLHQLHLEGHDYALDHERLGAPLENVVLGVGQVLRVRVPVGNKSVGLQLGAEVDDVDVLQLRGVRIECTGLNADVLDEFVLNEAEAGIDVHIVAVPELVQLHDPVEGLLGRCLVVVDRLVVHHSPLAGGGVVLGDHNPGAGALAVPVDSHHMTLVRVVDESLEAIGLHGPVNEGRLEHAGGWVAELGQPFVTILLEGLGLGQADFLVQLIGPPVRVIHDRVKELFVVGQLVAHLPEHSAQAGRGRGAVEGDVLEPAHQRHDGLVILVRQVILLLQPDTPRGLATDGICALAGLRSGREDLDDRSVAEPHVVIRLLLLRDQEVVAAERWRVLDLEDDLIPPKLGLRLGRRHHHDFGVLVDADEVKFFDDAAEGLTQTAAPPVDLARGSASKRLFLVHARRAGLDVALIVTQNHVPGGPERRIVDLTDLVQLHVITTGAQVSLHRLVIGNVIDAEALDSECFARMLLLVACDTVLALLTAQDPAQDSLLVGACSFVISFDGVGKEGLIIRREAGNQIRQRNESGTQVGFLGEIR